MSARTFLISLSSKAKRLGGADLALRYNPIARARAQARIDAFETPNLDMRRQLAEEMTAIALAQATRTKYGQNFGFRLQDWPLLSKERLRDTPEAFILPRLLRIPAATGGTTGVPIRLVRSTSSIAAEQAFLDSLLAGLDLSWASARLVSLRGDSLKSVLDLAPPYGNTSHFGRRLVLSGSHLTELTLHWYLDALERFRPEVMWAWPSRIAHLLTLLGRSGRRLRVPIVVTTSEQLSPELHVAIQQQIGAHVIDYYGLAERCALAHSTQPRCYLFAPAYGRVELLPDTKDTVEAGVCRVAIVATSYWNDAMPLVRYVTGDYALVAADSTAEDLEAIALGAKPFLGIAGRSDEFLYAPDGARLLVADEIPREVPYLLRIQVVQESLIDVVVRALVRPEFGPPEEAQLLANARAQLPPPMSVRIAVVDRLETVSSLGKAPLVIRRIQAPDGA